jgi:hypothetical protein
MYERTKNIPTQPPASQVGIDLTGVFNAMEHRITQKNIETVFYEKYSNSTPSFTGGD